MTHKQEGELKSQFTAEMKQRCPGFYVLVHATRAAPDRSISGGGKTSFWEFKHATPDFDSPGDQELMCQRLACASYCRYVIWWETSSGTGRKTMIVHPRKLAQRRNGYIEAEVTYPGFDHWEVVNFIRRLHGI